MAQAGVASRRKCEELILQGKVQVNGETVTELGTKADPDEDIITVNGKPISNEKKIYLILNKPKGVITSASDPEGRKIVSDYLKGVKERVYPIGRLDYDTEGLLLLTNDGEFANLLSHPKYHVPKTYLATVKGVPHGTELDKLRAGIMLEDGMTSPAEVEYKDVDPEGKQSVISITIHEGRNRQVRRMFEAISHPVLRLKRIAFGDLLLQNLKRGVYRHLTPDEINRLRQMAKPAKQAMPSKTAKPSTPMKLSKLSKPAKSAKPMKPSKPTSPAKSAKPAKSAGERRKKR